MTFTLCILIRKIKDVPSGRLDLKGFSDIDNLLPIGRVNLNSLW